MSTAIQRRRGTTAQHASFAGLNGELTVDTDKKTVVVHDGATAGGFPLARQDFSNVSSLALPAGAAATPVYSFTGDLNTGIYSPGADQLAISTGGSGRLFINSTGQVGVGTSSPEETLDANGAIVWRGSLNSGKTSAGALDRSGNDLRIRAYGATAGTGQLVFRTGGGGGSVDTEAMRIDASQRVGIGTSSPSSALHVVTSGAGQIRYFDGTVTGAFGSFGSGNEVFLGSGKALAFTTNGITSSETRMTIDTSGRVGIGTTTPLHNLDVRGSGTQTITVGTTDTSGSTVGQIRTLYLGGGGGANTVGFFRTGDGYSFLSSETNSPLLFGINSTERARIDSSGRLLVGTSTPRSNVYRSSTTGITPFMQIETSTNSYSNGLSIINNSASGFGAMLSIGTSNANGIGSNALNPSGGQIGTIQFISNDGTNFIDGANIKAEVDGTSGTNDMPTRLMFSTTADGASSPTERMRITSAGALWAGNTSRQDTDNHTFNATASTADWVAHFRNAGTSAPYGVYISYPSAAPNGTSSPFLRGSDSSSTRFEFRSNGGLSNYQANNVNLSDRNTKKDISPAAGTWDCIKEWEIVNYRYKDQPDDADLNLGVIAQQVAESCPEVITVFSEATEDEPEKLGVKEQQMYWMAIKALQEAQVRIEALEAEVAALKAQ